MTRNEHQHGPASEGRLPGPEESEDPGAYIGRMPERSTETIPGGLSAADERVSAVATQSSGGGADERPAAMTGDTPPSGHAVGEGANDDRRREAGDRE
jgi:hypothetical protein